MKQICPSCNKEFEPTTKHGYTTVFCSRSCSSKRPKSEESKKKTSDSMKNYGLFTKILFCSCKMCNRPFTWNSVTKGSKQHCSSPLCEKQFKYECRKGKVGGYRKNSTRLNKSVYNGYQMDSGAELAFAKLCDTNKIKWIKNTETFFEYLPNKKYYPDFYLEDYDIWVEIKGKRYYREDDPIRWASVKNLEVIWSGDIHLPSKILAIRMGNDPI